MKKIPKIFVIASLFSPLLVYAVATPNNFAELIDIFLGWVNTLIPIAFSAALLVFLWGIAQFVLNSDSPTGIADGKQKMFWGVVGLFVIFSIWGILMFLGSSVGISVVN